MKIEEVFQKHALNFRKIENDIEAFQFENEYASDIVSIYIHNNEREMFIVVDATKHNADIKRYCEHWEQKVLAFVNFDDNFYKSMKYLKYNISLVLLYNNEKNLEIPPVIMQEEKSLSVCRKIFLQIDDNKDILENNLNYLPFFFKETVYNESPTYKTAEINLKNILPVDDKMSFILEQNLGELSDETISDEKNKVIPVEKKGLIERWLDNGNYQKS